MKNNFAFIDGQNLHFGIKSLGWKLDHKKFRTYLQEEHGVERAYIFLGYMEEHQDLYNVLQEAGFICFFKPLVRYDDGSIKGNVDADMVLQVMVDIDNYDGAVIVSGDGDFSGMLRHLSFKNKLGQVIIPNRDKYSSLFDRIDDFDTKHVTYMNDLKSKLYYSPGKNRAPRKPADKTDNAVDPTAGQPQEELRLVSEKTPTISTKQPAKPAAKPRPTKRTDSKEAKPKPRNNNSAPRDNSQKPQRPRRQQNSQQSRNRKPQAPKSGFKPKSVLEASLIDAIDNNPSD